MSPSKATKRNNSSKGTKRDTPSHAKAQGFDPSTDTTDAEAPSATDIPHEHAHQPLSSNSHHHPHDHAGAESAKRKSTASVDNDLTTWAHLSVDRGGATLRTICTQERENGETCQHSGHERRYHAIPRVDEPVMKISLKGVKALEEGDGVAEREEDEEGWVVLDRA